MKRTLFALVVSLVTAVASSCGTATAQGTTAVSDTFSPTALGATWITHGGGTLHVEDGQLSAVGTPSEPVSFAFNTTPANGATQQVSATIHWHGRSPEHSAMSVALRADPASGHGGVHFWFTATLMGIAILSWDGTEFVPATGTPAYNQILRRWPEGTRIALKATGDTYAAYVSTTPWWPVLWGTFTEAQVPHTNAFGGVHGQDDSAVPGAGQPPANLDNFQFDSEVDSNG